MPTLVSFQGDMGEPLELGASDDMDEGDYVNRDEGHEVSWDEIKGVVTMI